MTKGFFTLVLLSAIMVCCSYCSTHKVYSAIPNELNAETPEIYIGELRVHLFRENITDTTQFRFDVGAEEPLFIKGSSDGLVILLSNIKETKPVLTGIFISRPDVEFYMPVSIPLGDRYQRENIGVHCFGHINLYYTPYQQGQAEKVPAITLEPAEAELPPGVELSGDLICPPILRDVSEKYADAAKEINARIKEKFLEIDPLYLENIPAQVLILPKELSETESMRPYTLVRVNLKDGSEKIESIISQRDNYIYLLKPKSGDVEKIELQAIEKLAPFHSSTSEKTDGEQKEISEDTITKYIESISCPLGANFKEVVRTKPRPSTIEVIAQCGDAEAIGEFIFKIKTEVGNLQKKCSSRFDCKGDACVSGYCARKCKDVSDCGGDENKAVCIDELCWLRCDKDDQCPEPSEKCLPAPEMTVCLPPLESSKTKPATPTQTKK